MRRKHQRKVSHSFNQMSTLNMDIVSKQDDDSNDVTVSSIHSVSTALDGLNDKDELVRTFQRCRADHLEMTPPSVLLRWDITEAELPKVVPSLPKLLGSSDGSGADGDGDDDTLYAVLKQPMGKGGQGIYFVKGLEEIYTILEEHRSQGHSFLDAVMEQKGRIPAWGKSFSVDRVVVVIVCVCVRVCMQAYTYMASLAPEEAIKGVLHMNDRQTCFASLATSIMVPTLIHTLIHCLSAPHKHAHSPASGNSSSYAHRGWAEIPYPILPAGCGRTRRRRRGRS